MTLHVYTGKGLAYLGEKVNFSEEELTIFRNLIIEQENKWKSAKHFESLVLFLIWFYEYLEIFSVNGSNKSTNYKSVRDTFGQKISRKLFDIRGKLVHRPFNIDRSSIIDFYTSNINAIDTLKTKCGFMEVKSMSYFGS